nr:MAG TPA: hypothetical protein [Caudoviricetes sp.]
MNCFRRFLKSLAMNRTLHGCRSIDLARMLSVYLSATVTN